MAVMRGIKTYLKDQRKVIKLTENKDLNSSINVWTNWELFNLSKTSWQIFSEKGSLDSGSHAQ